MGDVMETETNPVGRPTKYTPELLEQTRQYIEDYERHEHAFPSISGLAYVLDIGERTLHTWKTDDKKPEFQHILNRLMAKQQNVLFFKGCNGDYNSNIVKLALGKHGYHDKQDTTHSGNIEVTRIERVIVHPSDPDS